MRCPNCRWAGGAPPTVPYRGATLEAGGAPAAPLAPTFVSTEAPKNAVVAPKGATVVGAPKNAAVVAEAAGVVAEAVAAVVVAATVVVAPEALPFWKLSKPRLPASSAAGTQTEARLQLFVAVS